MTTTSITQETIKMKNLSNRVFKRLLRSREACDDAVKWIGARDMRTAWQECPRADWMLWILGRMTGQDGWPTREQVVAVACDCAETALKFAPEGEDRPRVCIETVRRYLRVEATIEEVREARSASAYAYASAAAAAADDAAADDADDAAAAAARATALRDMADMVRAAIPVEFVE